MENIEIIEDKTLELTFIVKDESHGVCNALRHIFIPSLENQKWQSKQKGEKDLE